MANQEIHATPPQSTEPVVIEVLELESGAHPSVARAAAHVNTTDATRGEPLARRARERRADLLRALDAVPLDNPRMRGDIEAAVAAIDTMLTGDDEHLSGPTAEEINRWLESSKHLGEMAPTIAPPREVH